MDVVEEEVVAPQPSKLDLRNAVIEYLTNNADITVITSKMLRNAMESQFNCNLEPSKDLVKEYLYSFIDSLVGKNSNDEDDDDDEEEEKKEEIVGKKRGSYCRELT